MPEQPTWELMAGSTPVSVTRKRVRNLNLRVRADGSVTLSIPWHASRLDAQHFLDERASWVAGALSAWQARQQYKSQDPAALWGKPVELPNGAPLPADGQLEALWRRELERALPDMAKRVEPLVGARASAWSLRSMSSRWGSCTPSTGRIRIALRLAAYPPECLEYVMVHELTHLLEPSHNGRFHALVARVIPNEREIRTRLRQPPIA